MRVLPKLLIAGFSLLCATGLFAQMKFDPPHSDDVLARLSYNETGPFKCCLKEPPPSNDGSLGAFSPEVDPAHICIAVSQDGEYRVVLALDGKIQHLQGKMPNEQFQQLKTLLSTPDFRALSGDHGGLLRRRAETFGAEIAQPETAGTVSKQKLQWLNPDGYNPFPPSVSNVIDWLKNFKPTGGKKFVYSEFSDVCPSRGFRLLQPAVAANGAP
jgi:hypothetical protein